MSDHPETIGPVKRFQLGSVAPIGCALLLIATVYACTLFGQVGYEIDTAKFHGIGRVLGSPHSPGYPLYMQCLKAASMVPLGTNRVRADAVSLVAAVAALAVLARVLWRLSIHPAAIAAALPLAGFAPLFWTHAVVAEVYAPLLFILALYILATRAHARTNPVSPAPTHDSAGLRTAPEPGARRFLRRRDALHS